MYVSMVLCGSILTLLFVLLILLIWLLAEERGTSACGRKRDPAVNAVPAPRGVSASPYARNGVWSVLLRDLDNGRQYQAVIDHPVVLGRMLPERCGYNEVGISQAVTVSKQQCMIYEVNGQLFLQNLSRINGTLLNGRLIQEPALLHQNDMIQAAEVRLAVYMLRIGGYAGG